MRLLVAEDDRITRLSLTRQLEQLGHTVTCAEDGEQAWECFQSQPFDIVLTDWEMPRLSGVDLIRRIRALESTAYVYLIMLTSRSEKRDLVDGIESGADDFVAKPFDREELRVRLLAGERVVRLERTLSEQNDALRKADQRIRRDLAAAARVQRALLPKAAVRTSHVQTAWTYVPTDELAGDAIGLDLIDDRYLVAYVVDVSGHGVPAALLAVTTMHALAPAGGGSSLLRGTPGQKDVDEASGLRHPCRIMEELNRRFVASDNDGRFLTMIISVLDTQTGQVRMSRAGHPMPILVRDGAIVPVDESSTFPLGVVDFAKYEDTLVQLRRGDRLFLYSDGLLEQLEHTQKKQFGEERVRTLLQTHHKETIERVVEHSVAALTQWAGQASFADDVTLVVLEWLGT